MNTLEQASKQFNGLDGKPSFDHVKVGAILRVAGALERIAAVLECGTTRRAAESLIRMDKRLAKSRPLGGRRAR